MGDDIPLAVLSDKPHMLYDYFKQRFAQVRGEYCGAVCVWSSGALHSSSSSNRLAS
jgi:hypothetical protein